jgi:hypothetical protein
VEDEHWWWWLNVLAPYGVLIRAFVDGALSGEWDEIRPDQRGWLWWDAEVTGARSAVVRLEKVDAAAVFGVSTWLVRAAGGSAISLHWVPTAAVHP